MGGVAFDAAGGVWFAALPNTLQKGPFRPIKGYDAPEAASMIRRILSLRALSCQHRQISPKFAHSAELSPA
jgi:hypothetical protein